MRLHALVAFSCLLLGLLWSCESHAQVSGMYGGQMYVGPAIPLGPPVPVGPTIITYGPANLGNTTGHSFYPPTLQGSLPAFQPPFTSMDGRGMIAFRPIYQNEAMNFQQSAPSYAPYGGAYGPSMNGGFQPRANTRTFDSTSEGSLNQIQSDLQAIKSRLGI